MKKIKKYLALACFLASLFFISGCSQGSAHQDISQTIKENDQPTIVWGVKADTNLFGQYSVEEGRITGFDIDLAQAITDKITDGKGRAEFVEVTSKTRIPLLKNENIDAIIATMTINEERAQQVDFSKVYFNGGQNLLVAQDSAIHSIEDLTADHTVIAIKGSSSSQNFRQLKPDVQVVELENYSEGFVALQAGQGDALTTDNAILLGMIENNPSYRLAGENFTVEPYGIAIDKSQKEFLNLVNEALTELVHSGEYSDIYHQWFGDLLPNDNLGKELQAVNDWVNENVYGDGQEDIISGSATIKQNLSKPAESEKGGE